MFIVNKEKWTTHLERTLAEDSDGSAEKEKLERLFQFELQLTSLLNTCSVVEEQKKLTQLIEALEAAQKIITQVSARHRKRRAHRLP